MSDLKQLLIDQKINKFEYDSYILFESNELGRIYLSHKIESLFMDSVEGMQIDQTYPFHFGRMSEWRDIKIAIVKINTILKEVENDRRSIEAEQYVRDNFTIRDTNSIPFGDRD